MASREDNAFARAHRAERVAALVFTIEQNRRELGELMGSRMTTALLVDCLRAYDEAARKSLADQAGLKSPPSALTWAQVVAQFQQIADVERARQEQGSNDHVIE